MSVVCGACIRPAPPTASQTPHSQSTASVLARWWSTPPTDPDYPRATRFEQIVALLLHGLRSDGRSTLCASGGGRCAPIYATALRVVGLCEANALRSATSSRPSVAERRIGKRRWRFLCSLFGRRHFW